MKNSTVQWHLARDNEEKLARFCMKQGTVSNVSEVYEIEGKGYFTTTFNFDNGAMIKAELKAGDKYRGYTVADHFAVVDYGWGRS